ncbi:MAG: translocation/assembly module TamB domain-containing protein [Rubrivivax sp.]|nr:translocation/assembly module TamB domain-containing protein [Rubrivivax sp.]
MDDAPATPPAPAPAARPSRRLAALQRLGRPAPLRAAWELLWPLAGVLLMGLVVLALLAAGAGWLMLGENGSRWLLQRLPGVEVQGFRGALLGSAFAADRVQLRWDRGRSSLLIEELRADGLHWRWRPDEHAWVGLAAERLAARRAELQLAADDAAPPAAAPADLRLPLALTLARAELGELQVDAQPPLRALQLDGLAIDPRPEGGFALGRASAEWQRLAFSAQGRLGHSAPLPLELQASVVPLAAGDTPPWAATLHAGGELARMDVQATLRGVPRGRRPAPEADLRAELRPFAAWPLGALHAQTQALDLAALSPQAPQTRLHGRAELRSSAADAPLTASVVLENLLPGRWNEARLPLRRLALELRGQLDQRDRIEATRFELLLADASATAGRVGGRALWQGHELTLATEITDLLPQRLDGRAAAMTLAGPLTATLRGLPSPDPAATGAPPPPEARWQLELTGRLEGAPLPVRVAMQGQADDRRLVLSDVRLASGAATAELAATLQRLGGAGRAGSGGAAEWQLQTEGRIADFDPVPWWPGEAGSAWRRGPHRLSATWTLDARVPGDAAGQPALAVLPRVAGNGTLRVVNSQLAGVPLAADLRLGYTRAAAPTAGSLQGTVTLGGNELVLDGRGDPAGPGGADRLRAELRAEQLAALAPVARLHPALADWLPRGGSALAVLAVDGRWPALRSEGSARVQQLAAGRLAVARGDIAWQVDLGGLDAARGAAAASPLTMQLDLAGLALGEQRADHLRATLSGTLASHRIDVSSALPLAPPRAAERMLGIQAQSGTRAQLQARGAWLPATGVGGGQWRATIELLRLGSWDGSPIDAPPASSWVEARDLQAELDFDAAGSLVALHAAAGRVRVTDAVAMRWDDVRVDLRGPRAQLALRADIEPFALAPLLARLQPTMGWQGDLRLAARVDVRAAERMEADLVFERADGDLHLAGGDGTQLMGLTALRLALTARDGLWTFEPSFRGRSIGELDGRLLVRTTPESRWPEPEAPVEGRVQARVADIGIWSTWVPPGWRLAGELRTTAEVSGRFGDPRFTGELGGSGLAVRNLLQGVNVSDGQVLVRLEGETARIERFTLRGGDGTLALTGDARLGREPQARLHAVAERFRVLGRVDRLVIASGSAELALQPDAGRLDGEFRVDEGLFDFSRADAPSLDDDVNVRRPGDPERGDRTAAAQTARRNFTMAVAVDLGEQLRVRGRGLEALLRGAVRISNPGGRLAVNGTINTEAGTYAAYGQRLEIERGILAFSGPADNPRLDVLALRPNLDVRVGVAITGNLLTPRVRLYSEPELPDSAKLSWLLLGREPDGLGRDDTALIQRAAVAILSGESEAPTDALLRNLGIDEIGLRQSGDGDVRETVITLGKQLSRRWYLGYERGVNATTGTWQLIYRIAQRFTLRAQSGLDNSLDVIWTWRFQETPADAAMRKSVVVPP